MTSDSATGQMYHTFQAAASGSTDAGGGKPIRPTNSRRISTTNACIECRRRKIRCDGAQPCGQCQWYQHPGLCAYAKPVQRVVPSRKLLEKLQSQADQYRTICARLFPGKELGELTALSRADLLDLALEEPTCTASPPLTAGQIQMSASDVQKPESVESLEGLEQAPEQDPEVDEAKRHKDRVQGISDDINGLSLSVDKATTYVGISSISAAMKAMFRIAPLARTLIKQASIDTAGPSRISTPPHFQHFDPGHLPEANVSKQLIESYFAHIHVLMPMLDEEQFWSTYLYSNRTDSPWLSLLNVVFALGSLASSTCKSQDHTVFYRRAMYHLEGETFGSGSLYALQALALLSGYYLHYLNRPNEANGLMGGTLRMATAHGLHREFAHGDRYKTIRTNGLEVPAEIRRRTWWSLYCLDSWASITAGRPSLGRTGPGITVETPRIPDQTQMNNAQYLASLRLLPIVHNVGFCKIATKVQDLLATQSMLTFNELFTLNKELETWHTELPPILRDVVQRLPVRHTHNATADGHGAVPLGFRSASVSSQPDFDLTQHSTQDRVACPEELKTPRAIMHWRYQNLLIIMHRPQLLATALKRTRFSQLSADEKAAVRRCRIVAGQAVADIDATCQENLIAGWNAVWMMYQAVMVPLISLFSVLTMPPPEYQRDGPSPASSTASGVAAANGSDDDIERWRREVETAINFFDRMRTWSVAASESRDVVQRLYDATNFIDAQRFESLQPAEKSQELQPAGSSQQFAWNGVPLSDLQQTAGVTNPYFSSSDMGAAFMPVENNSADFELNGTVTDFWDEMMWSSFPEDEAHGQFADGTLLPDFSGQAAWFPTPSDEHGWPHWPNASGQQ